MTKKGKQGRVWILAAVGVLVLALVLVLEAAQGANEPIYWVIRTAALMGYFCVFGSILSSAYMKQLVRFFGRSFVQVHHVVAISGLALIVIHPLAVAWNASSLQVFVPATNSWFSFFALGGRPAWYLIGVAAVIAFFRKRIGRNWKLLHMLNYLAFWLATVHGILIGSNVQGIAMRVLFVLLALIVLGVLVQKRLAVRRRKKR
jgi:sulfoxide reductase heme-binding subunit YedZ